MVRVKLQLKHITDANNILTPSVHHRSSIHLHRSFIIPSCILTSQVHQYPVEGHQNLGHFSLCRSDCTTKNHIGICMFAFSDLFYSFTEEFLPTAAILTTHTTYKIILYLYQLYEHHDNMENRRRSPELRTFLSLSFELYYQEPPPLQLNKENGGCDIFDENYSTLEAETLKSFQNDVLFLLRSTSLTPEIHRCTINVASKLVSLTFLHKRKWTELFEFSSDVLASGNHSLNSILEILCSQNVIYQSKFLKSFEPYFQIEHFNVLSSLLRKGDNYHAFMVLPSICLMLRRELWGSLMETAILSPFFDRETVSLRRLHAASSLRFCIQHSFFNFSSEMVIKVTRLIFNFLQSSDSSDNRMGKKLCGALLGSCFPE
ncbi:hypothetical protein C2S51_015633 [Perilla frutescens var. frutescens]|nr:hypothetical protein C2S51_015633 [Perilla frutescens var. frutescens]